MGGKKTMEDSRRFEKDRRDKLNAAFEMLSKLLPEYNPAITLSKIEIIRKAADYIKLLQVQNEEILKMGSDSVLKNESEKLKKRVACLVLKTKELVDALRCAEVTIQTNKNTKKKKITSNQNLIASMKQLVTHPEKKEELKKVKCGCMRSTFEKMPLKEVNATVACSVDNAEQLHTLTDSTNIISITPLDTVPIPIPTTTADQLTDTNPISICSAATIVLSAAISTASPSAQPNVSQSSDIASVGNSSTPNLNPTLHPLSLVHKNLVPLVKDIISTPLSKQSLSVVATTSSSVVPTQTIISTNASMNIPQTNITNSKVITPSVQNISVVDKNILSNFGSGTLILTDGRLVNVPQILPQILTVKQPSPVILMPTAKKKEKLLMPKKREVTKTTFAYKVPIPAIPSFRLESCPKVRPKKKIKQILKGTGKIKTLKAVESNISKRRKLQDEIQLSKSDSIKEKSNKTITSDNSVEINETSSMLISNKDTYIGPQTSVDVMTNNSDKITTSNSEQILLSDSTPPAERSNVEKAQENDDIQSKSISHSVSLYETEEDPPPPDTSEKNTAEMCEPTLQIPGSTTPLLSNSNAQVLSPCDVVMVDKDSTAHISDTSFSEEVVSLSERRETVTSLTKSVGDKICDINKITATKCSKIDKTKDVISNIPPCISSCTIQNSLFTSTTQSLPLPASILPNNNEENTDNATKNNGTPMCKSVQVETTEVVETTSLTVLPEETKELNTSPKSLSETPVATDLQKLSTTTSSQAEVDSLNASVCNEFINYSILSSKESFPEKQVTNVKNPESFLTSNLAEACAPIATPSIQLNSDCPQLNEGKNGNERESTMCETSLASHSEEASVPLQESNFSQINNCLSELSQSTKSYSTNAFIQPSSSELQNQNKVSLTSNGSSYSTAKKTSVPVLEPTLTSSSSLNVNHEHLKTSGFTVNNKNSNSGTVPFNPSNLCRDAGNNMYSGYPSAIYCSHESQSYPQGTFPVKHLNSTSDSQPVKPDAFGSLTQPLSTETAEKCFYPQNILQSSLHRTPQWDKEPCSKQYNSVTSNTWDNQVPKQKTTQSNKSKSVEKERSSSQKGYSDFQGDAVPTTHSNILFSDFTANPSALSVSSTFPTTSSTYPYYSSCSTVSSYSIISSTDKTEQSYISNNNSKPPNIPSSLKSSDKINAGYYSNNSHSSDLRAQANTSMKTDFVSTNAYIASERNSLSGYPLSCNASSVQGNSVNSSQSLFHYNSTTQSNVAPIFTTAADVYMTKKSNYLVSSTSATLESCAPPNLGFTSKPNSSVSYIEPSNALYTTSVESSTLSVSSISQASVQTNSSHLSLPTNGSLNLNSLSVQLSPLQSTSSVHASSTITSNQPSISTISLPGSSHFDSTNSFNSFALTSLSINPSQPPTNGSTTYLTSMSNLKSSVVNQANDKGLYGSSFTTDAPNMFNSVSLKTSSNAPVGALQPIITTAYTSLPSNKPLILTQASTAGPYSSSLQLDSTNTFVSTSQMRKTGIQANLTSLPVAYSASLPTISSTYASQTSSTSVLNQTSTSGIYTNSSQPDITNVFSSMALPNIQSTQYKLPPLPHTENSIQNTNSSKGIQTSGIYSGSFQPDSMNVFSAIPQSKVQTITTMSNGSLVYSSSTSINNFPGSVQVSSTEVYGRSQTDLSNSFTNLSLPNQTESHRPHLQANVFPSNTAYKSGEESTASSKYQTGPPNSTDPSLYIQKNNRSSKNANCIPRTPLQSDQSNVTSGSECNQLLRSSNKNSEPATNLNSTVCDVRSSNNINEESNVVSQKTANRIDSNSINDSQRRVSEIECTFMSNKGNLSNNYSDPTLKENSVEGTSAAKRVTYSSNLRELGSAHVSQQSMNNQSAIDKTSEDDLNNAIREKYSNSNKGNMIQNNSADKSGTELECIDKAAQNNSNFTGTPNSSNTNSTTKSNKQISADIKSVPAEINGVHYDCNIMNSGSYHKSFSSHRNVNLNKLSEPSFPTTSYSNYNSTPYDSISNQFPNTVLPLSNAESSIVCSSSNIVNSGHTYENVSKGTPLNISVETMVEKQSKSIQKTYPLGNTLKGDMHLELLKSKDLEKNTFIPIGYEDVRIPSDFSSDLFNSLQVPSGGQHSESISPTAAFLLAFPLVSTSRNVENLHETDNHENQTSTPTTILQIGNIDPPTTELFHPIEFQKNNAKSSDQYDINNDYLQLPDLHEKQNSTYKRCDKRKDSFSEYGKDIRLSKQKSNKTAVPTASTYTNSYVNPLLSCNDNYQFCEKDNAQWQQEFTQTVQKESKKGCDRKKDKPNQKVCYHQNYQDCFNYKDKKRKQQNRISVNWMSTSENREQVEYQPKEVDGIVAPPTQTMFSGISLDFPTESFPDLSNLKKTNNYSWSPSKSLLPSLDNHLMIPSTLPTLVGDLALGTSTPSESYKTFEAPKLPLQVSLTKKTAEKLDEAKKRNEFPKNQANFFSVSQLVDPKSKRQKTGDKNYRRPEKQSKGRNNFNCTKRKDDHCMYYEDKNAFIASSQYSEKRNPYKGGSYSAESLIGAQTQELEFSSNFNYQQNTSYFPNEFTNNLESSNQQYAYLQQTHIGSFNQDECQDFGFGTTQRNMETFRQKTVRKEDNYPRESTGTIPHLTSYPPYSKSINYNLPPPSQQVHSINTNSTNTLTNFNLSTIFPEMNDQRVTTAGQPPQPINHSFPNSQNYRSHLPQ